MDIYTVTLRFTDLEAATWLAKCASASVKTHERLDACRAGIMQDAIAKAYEVVTAEKEIPTWEKGGGIIP